MDINNNLMQTNTFIKGMNTDTSDALLSNEQYRYAENIRIVTDTESNSGEAHLIEGTVTSLFTIYENGAEIENVFENNNILATNAVRNIGITILQRNDGWCVLKTDFDAKKTHWLFGPCTESIVPENWDGKGKVISTVLRYESDNNIKLYISDLTGKHPIMMLPILDNDHIGTDFDTTFAYLSQVLPSLDVDISTSSGILMSGMVQYAYRLYSKQGAATAISPLSKVLSLYKDNTLGYPAKKRTGRAVDIKYPDISYPKLDHIQVYRISYLESGQQPTINLIKDEPINVGSTIDTGASDILTLSVAEFLSMIDSLIIPKQIESKGDYLFAANLKYAQDNADELFEDFDAKSYSSGSKYKNNYVFELDANTWDEIKDAQYLTHDAFSNSANYITYNSSYFASVFNPRTAFNSQNTYVCNDNIPSGYNGYGKCFLWKYTYASVYDDGSEVYATDPLDNSKRIQLNTFRSEEVYRFGVRLFDKRGRASSVKWIADIMIPPISYITNNNGLLLTGIEFKINNSYDHWQDNWENVSAYEIVRCPRTIADRCTITLGITGLAMSVWNDKWRSNGAIIYDYVIEHLDQICTSGFLSHDKISTESVEKIDLGVESSYHYLLSASTLHTAAIMFASPEYCYLPDDVKDILLSYKDNIRIDLVVRYNVNTNRRTVNNRTYYYSKQYSNSNMPYSLYIQYDDGDPVSYFIDPITMDYNTNWENDANKSLFGKTTNYSGTTANVPTRWFLNYLTPNYSSGIYKYNNYNRLATKIAFAKAPQYSDFANGEEFSYDNNVTSIGDKLFVNWSVPMMLKFYDVSTKNTIKAMMDNIDGGTYSAVGDWLGSSISYPISSGGQVILLKSDYSDYENNSFTVQSPSTPSSSNVGMPRIYISNIRKPAIPYGGYNKTSIDNSKYMSTGDFKYITYDDNNNIENGETVNVFSGDTKISPFVYNAAHNWYDSTYRIAIKTATIYRAVIECDVDTKALYGSLYGSDEFYDYRLLDYACGFDTFTQEKDAYLYNTVYNSTPDVLTWTTDAEDTKRFNNYDTRIHYSEQKTNNEQIDSWLLFKSLNFIDTDTRHGEITGMKLFKDKLIFWQENAAGIAAVNERIVLKDASDNKVQLGTGGVLERTDYISTLYGLKSRQLAYETSNDYLYWWDSDRKELLQYSDGYSVNPLISNKQVKNYINSAESESETPTLIYDNKYKELLCNLVDEESLVYSELLQLFTSVYTFNPAFKWLINNILYLTKNKFHQYKYNSSSGGSSYLWDKLGKAAAYPLILYVVNKDPQYNKTFDIQTFGGRFYGGNTNHLDRLYFGYKTPLKQTSGTLGNTLTNIEYDFRLTIPRNGAPNDRESNKDWGDRMRGKTMQCMFKSTSNDLDFSLQYITTKFRMSWT